MTVHEGTTNDRLNAGLSGYEPDFGLREAPFTLTPNPRYLFESRSHAEAFEQVAAALPRYEPLVVITGEVGTGKTMLCRMIAECRDERTFVAAITTPPASGDDLLRQLLDEFGVLPRDSSRVAYAGHFELVRTLQQFLASLIPLNGRAVIVVDEAHRLPSEVFEQLRVLSNMETDARKLIQIILVGEPQLDEVLARPEMRHLRQRVTRFHELRPLLPTEVRPYIERRLVVAHRSDEPTWRIPFTASAMDAVATLSLGIPRLVNVLCDRALETAHGRKQQGVDIISVLTAADTLRFEIPSTLYLRAHGRQIAAAAIIVLILLGVVGWWASHSELFRWSATVRSPATLAKSETVAPASSASNSSAEPVAAIVGDTPASPSNPSSFLIVVASFRTPSRATSLAEDLGRLDLHASTRASASGWTQVVVGPYASREEADQARQQLIAAHLADSQIVSGVLDRTPDNESTPLQVRDVLERAAAMARRPDVKGLLQLRAQVAAMSRATDRSDVEAVLKQLDSLLDEARRRQLAIDAR